MYWSHSDRENQKNLIEESTLDGSSRKIIFNAPKSVQSLAIDFKENRLYFVYSNSGLISYLDFARHEVKYIFHTTIY